MRAIRVRSATQWAAAAELRGRDDGDRRGRVWLTVDGELAVGTIRAVYGADGELGDAYDRFGLGPFADAVGADRLVVYDRLAIRTGHRSSLALPLLRKVVAEDSLRRGADVAFHACEPATVAEHRALGFRRYLGRDTAALDGRVPMVLTYADRAHLAAAGSPIRHRIPETIATELDRELAALVIGAAAPGARPRAHRRAPTAARRRCGGHRTAA